MSDEKGMMLYANDDCFERARKILKAAGMIDGCGLASRMAESLEAYRKMDVETGRREVLETPVTVTK